jgi:surface antigen
LKFAARRRDGICYDQAESVERLMLRRSAVIGALAGIAVLAGCKSGTLVPTAPIAYAPSDDVGAVGLLGTTIGVGVADIDRKIGLNAEYRALERGEAAVAVEWRGRAGSAGVVVPGPSYKINDYDCRRFTHTVSLRGTTESATATACRTPEGVWRLVG